MSKSTINQINNAIDAETRWKDIYRVGGVATIAAAVLFLIEIIVFIIWPQPTTVINYFTLFRSNKLIGLLDFYLLEIIATYFWCPYNWPYTLQSGKLVKVTWCSL